MAVYIYLLPTINKVKIGFSNDLENRIKSLATHSFENGKIIRVFPDFSNLGEAYLHEKYKHLRTHGEWFEYDDEMLIVDIPPEYTQTARGSLPNFQMIGTGMTNRHGIDSFPLVDTALDLTKPEANLFKLIYAAYDRNTGLSVIDSAHLTPSQRSKRSVVYSQLKERGLVKRVKQKTYMINPSAVINTSLYTSLKEQWDSTV